MNPQDISIHDTIEPKSGGDPQVVKAISVVLHLANGYDEVYPSTEQVTVIDSATDSQEGE